MALNEKKHSHLRDQFFRELEALINNYPELTQASEDFLNHFEEEHPNEFNAEAPSIITAIVLAVTVRNSEDWENLFYITPYGQSHFHTLGMLTNVVQLET
jgi:hypothetical protein